MNRDNIVKFLHSWFTLDSKITSTNDIIKWIEYLNQETFVDINECELSKSNFWFYDEYKSEVLNIKSSFFSIRGIRMFQNGEFICEQPIINQPEIGYLGIICKEFDGILHFLMQAKIEPGNINCVQISPTIQATKSNFTRVHGGKLPSYFTYFENAKNYEIIYDQIQSEQAARFYKKRNRNIIIKVNDDIEVKNNFKWMTLGQIKELMKMDNLVNMDTRTVISGIPFFSENNSDDLYYEYNEEFRDKPLLKSIYNSNNSQNKITEIYHYINSYKMFNTIERSFVPLNQLINWKIKDNGIYCKDNANFEVKYYDINIKGREVQHWIQPLFKATGKALFGLITRNNNGIREFLVNAISEVGSFDIIEIGPTVYMESNNLSYQSKKIIEQFMNLLNNGSKKLIDVMLSEEGGRFYHEENRNIIIEVPDSFIFDDSGFFWVDMKTLIKLIQINNCVNIQLRNLISLLEV